MNKEKIAIIGLGYVGLPLAIEFASQYDVVGFDINPKRIEELINGYDRTLEISKETLESRSKITFTDQLEPLKSCTVYIVTVPTPIDSENKPDFSYLTNSSNLIGQVLKKNDLVIYESTVYPGATEEHCVPVLEEISTLKVNQDFFVGYSPERINPGDHERPLKSIIKITSGSCPSAGKKVDDLYKSVSFKTHPVSSIKVAEAAKVIENTQRDVNIALINELAIICDHIGINTKEVIEAAATKWNFIKFVPGLVGGHCIGIDPYYLTFKSESLGYKPNLILDARLINNGMGQYIAQKTIKTLIQANASINGSNILILGLTFKENCPDMRNTKVVDIITELKEFGANVDVYDPWVDPKEEKKTYKHGLISNPFQNSKKYKAIIVAVAHDEFKKLKLEDYEKISEATPSIIIDVKGIAPQSTWTLF